MGVLKSAAPAPAAGPGKPAGPTKPPDDVLDRILHLSVEVTVVLAERMMSLKDVVNLTQGTILEFQKSVDQPLELRILDKKIAQGEAVKISEKFGLQIAQIGSPRETAKLLGGR